MQRIERFIPDQRWNLNQYIALTGYLSEEFYAYNKAFFCGFDEAASGIGNCVVYGWNISSVAGLVVGLNQTNDSYLFTPERTGYENFIIWLTTDPALTVSLADNATNYVEVQINDTLCGTDTVTLWDSTANDDAGEEYLQSSQTVDEQAPTLVANTTGFTGLPNSVPLATIVTSSGAVSTITDSRPLFFEGSAWSWPSPRSDSTIGSIKDAYDAITTSIKEFKGTTNWYDVPGKTFTAGVNITQGQAVYVSTGAGLDSLLTAGDIYLTDAGSTNGGTRSLFAGFATSAISSSAVGNVISRGIANIFTGLTVGAAYYLDPTTNGGITSTKPGTVGQWIVFVGIALSSTSLLISDTIASQVSSSSLAWDSTKTYAQGDIVSSYPAGLYQSLQSSNLNHVVTAQAYWLPVFNPPVIKTLTVSDSPYTITSTDSGKTFLIDTSSGAVSIQLVSSVPYFEFEIIDETGFFGTNPVTLLRAGSETIQNVGANLILSAPYVSKRFKYDFVGNLWIMGR